MTAHEIVEDWTFERSRTELRWRVKRVKASVQGICSAPPHVAIRPVTRRESWTVYFVYAPTGHVSESQRFTIRKLKESERALCVVCATPDPSSMPEELSHTADALYWKHMRGFDFSAYRIGLHAVARHSTGSDVLLLNDSVLGPFSDINALLARSPWAMTGFTASASRENHIQSYAFHLSDVTPLRLKQLQTVLPGSFAFNTYDAVITCQETRMARIASHSMSVGSLWYCADRRSLPLVRATELLDRGFPFIKRSLLNKSAHFQDLRIIHSRLESFGHPLTEANGISIGAH
jgi:hypothetical protein